MNYKTKVQKNYKLTIAIVFGIILVVAMMAQLTFLSIFGTKGSSVAQIRSEQKRLILENELYEVKISKMQSLDRIRKVATNELGMTKVEKIEYITPTTVISSNQE